jgi:hypothetical protein
MRAWTAIGCGLVLVGVGQAGPLKNAYVDGEALGVAHIDVEQLKSTQIGTWLQQELKQPEAESKFAALKAILNFDPREDLRSLTAYTWASGKGALLLEGQFDPERTVTLLKADDGYRAQTYSGVTVHSWIEKHEKDKESMREAHKRGGKPGANPPVKAPHRHYGAFMPNNVLAVADDVDSLQRAMDVLQGRRPALSPTSPLTALIPANVPLLVAGSDLSKLKPDARPNQSATFDGVTSASVAASERGGRFVLSVDVVAKDEAAATNVRSVVQGVAALGALNAQQNPAGAELARSLACTVNGRQVNISLDYSADKVVQWLVEKKREKASSPGDGNQ